MTLRWIAATRRLSLKRQQLLFFGGVLTVMMILIAISLGVANRQSQVFGSNLTLYFHIHELRTSVSAAQDELLRYLRTGDTPILDSINARRPSIRRAYDNLEAMNLDDLDSSFELRATYYGLLAYEGAVTRAVQEFQEGNQQFIFTREYAGRLADYIDLYLQRLFRIQLEQGRQGYRIALLQQQQLQWWTFLGFAGLAGALVAFALLFSRSVTHPLEKLAAAAEELSRGYFDGPAVTLPESVELRAVARAFNSMSAGIRTLIADLQDKHELELRLHQQELSNISMERSLREAQLVALQSQVNPHFLFNTLNSVARTARVEEAARSEQLIRGLSTVLRYILRNPRRSVSLQDELHIAEQYLDLQQVRFGQRLNVEITAAHDVMVAQIPPLILQPLVENAVIYGVEPVEDGGLVRIRAHREGGQLVVEVEDNGTGMDADTVNHLLQDDPDTSGEETRGIGVLNVRNRLALFFGPDHQFLIRSSPGAGTKITLRVPLHVAAETYGIHAADRR